MKDQSKNPKRKASNRNVRQERHLRNLGTRQPKCSKCVENEPVTLTGRQPKIVCYECKTKAEKRSPIEHHHPAKRKNDSFTISIPGNDHRFLSDLQEDWPLETLRNPNGSPLRKASAMLRGWLDVLRLLIERIFGWIPEFLENLDAKLTEHIGAIWWDALGLSAEIDR